MNRREFVSAVAGLGGTAMLAGCAIGGEALLRKTGITATSPSKE